MLGTDNADLEQEVEDEHLLLKESKKYKLNQLSEFKEVWIPLKEDIILIYQQNFNDGMQVGIVKCGEPPYHRLCISDGDPEPSFKEMNLRVQGFCVQKYLPPVRTKHQ